jgi:hypothetical protein
MDGTLFRAGNRFLRMLEGSLARKERRNHLGPAQPIAETQNG